MGSLYIGIGVMNMEMYGFLPLLRQAALQSLPLSASCFGTNETASRPSRPRQVLAGNQGNL